MSKLPLILLVLCLCLAACQAGPALPPTETAAPTLAVSPTPTDVFEVVAWVDNPNPKRGERVVANAYLSRNGVILSQIRYEAWWDQPGHDPAVPNCYGLLIYQRGICTLNAGDFPPGEYVPIKFRIFWNDRIYTAETGFTPQ